MNYSATLDFVKSQKRLCSFRLASISFIACLTAASEIRLAFQPTPTPAGDEKPQFAISSDLLSYLPNESLFEEVEKIAEANFPSPQFDFPRPRFVFDQDFFPATFCEVKGLNFNLL